MNYKVEQLKYSKEKIPELRKKTKFSKYTFGFEFLNKNNNFMYLLRKIILKKL